MSVFEEACYLSNQRWVASLPTEFEPIQFSIKHEKAMKILFDKMRGGRYHRLTRRVTAALIAAILIVSMTITAFAIPASRDYIIHKFFERSMYSVVNGEHTEVEDIKIAYIPAGFEVIDHYIDESTAYYEYQNANKDWFQVKKMSLYLKTNIDTEKNNYQVINYKSKSFISYISDNSNAFIWNDGRYEYTITGNLSNEILLEIADTVS